MEGKREFSLLAQSDVVWLPQRKTVACSIKCNKSWDRKERRDHIFWNNEMNNSHNQQTYFPNRLFSKENDKHRTEINACSDWALHLPHSKCTTGLITDSTRNVCTAQSALIATGYYLIGLAKCNSVKQIHKYAHAHLITRAQQLTHPRTSSCLPRNPETRYTVRPASVQDKRVVSRCETVAVWLDSSLKMRWLAFIKKHHVWF